MTSAASRWGIPRRVGWTIVTAVACFLIVEYATNVALVVHAVRIRYSSTGGLAVVLLAPLPLEWAGSAAGRVWLARRHRSDALSLALFAAGAFAAVDSFLWLLVRVVLYTGGGRVVLG